MFLENYGGSKDLQSNFSNVHSLHVTSFTSKSQSASRKKDHFRFVPPCCGHGRLNVFLPSFYPIAGATEAKMTWLTRLSWLFYTTTTVIGLTISLVFWTVIFPFHQSQSVSELETLENKTHTHTHTQKKKHGKTQ